MKSSNLVPKVIYGEYTPDSVVQSIIENYIERAQMGEKKYGVTLDRKDLELLDYLQHAKEEAMDLTLYLEKAIQIIKQND
jgi:hypothetical protein